MENRLFLIVVVMTIGGLIWLSTIRSEPEIDPEAKAIAEATLAEVAGASPRDATAPPGDTTTTEATQPAGGPSAAVSAAVASDTGAARPEPSPEQLATLTAEGNLRIVVSSRGGALRSVFPLDSQYDRPEGASVSPVPPPHKTSPGPLDLVSTWDPEFYPLQLDFSKLNASGLVQFDSGPSLSLSEAWVNHGDFGIAASPQNEGAAQSSDTVVFVWPDPAKATSPVYVERRFRVTGPYRLEMTTTLYNLTREDATAQFDLLVHAWQDPAASTGSLFSPPADVANGACLAGSLTYEPYHDLAQEPEAPPGLVQWAGVATHYFLLAAAPTPNVNTQCTLQGVGGGVLTARIHQTQSAVVAAAPNPCAPDWLPRERFAGPRCTEFLALLGAPDNAGAKELADAKGRAVAAAVGDDAKRRAIEEAYESLVGAGSRQWTHTIYAGPKDIDALNEAGAGLAEALDFGMLSFLALPMLYFLRWAESIVGLWALAIVLLTLVVKLLMLPLTQKSFKQMKAMKALQPEMEKLREKYKDDKARMNQEVMALYRTRGANPLGGCLPMVLQMPVYIALYQTIYSAVELYQAPLFGWITNMTSPDPYFVLPLLLGGTMFVQQKLMPTTMDNAQAKMMAVIMPIMFTGMMLFLPAGLVLYIFVNTLLGIAQQWWVYRQPA